MLDRIRITVIHVYSSRDAYREPASIPSAPCEPIEAIGIIYTLRRRRGARLLGHLT